VLRPGVSGDRRLHRPVRQEQEGPQHEVHDRARDGDVELLPGVLRDPRHPRQPPDGQQRDALHLHPIAQRDHAMPEFVQQHAGEQADGDQRLRKVAAADAEAEEPPDEQQEREVKPNRNPEDPADLNGPGHALPSP
jgi:hypothetical protein